MRHKKKVPDKWCRNFLGMHLMENWWWVDMSKIFQQISTSNFFHQISWCYTFDVQFWKKCHVEILEILRVGPKIGDVGKSPTNEFPICFLLGLKSIQSISEAKIKSIGLNLTYVQKQTRLAYFRKYCTPQKWFCFLSRIWPVAKLRKLLSDKAFAECYLSPTAFRQMPSSRVSVIFASGNILRTCLSWR